VKRGAQVADMEAARRAGSEAGGDRHAPALAAGRGARYQGRPPLHTLQLAGKLDQAFKL
jgi:hypothetical protein